MRFTSRYRSTCSPAARRKSHQGPGSAVGTRPRCRSGTTSDSARACQPAQHRQAGRLFDHPGHAATVRLAADAIHDESRQRQLGIEVLESGCGESAPALRASLAASSTTKTGAFTSLATCAELPVSSS